MRRGARRGICDHKEEIMLVSNLPLELCTLSRDLRVWMEGLSETPCCRRVVLAESRATRFAQWSEREGCLGATYVSSEALISFFFTSITPTYRNTLP